MRMIALFILFVVALPWTAFADWTKPQDRDAVIQRMKGWEVVPPEDWTTTPAPTVLELLTPMLGGFPSRMEGRPSISLEVRKLEDDSLMLAHLRMRRFLDDSVNGKEFTALIDSNDNGWALVRLWRRHECARGRKEGRWVTSPCS